ncbi:hypothetical protein ADUPG1_000586, partial [Aduncisulcus paluster]
MSEYSEDYSSEYASDEQPKIVQVDIFAVKAKIDSAKRKQEQKDKLKRAQLKQQMKTASDVTELFQEHPQSHGEFKEGTYNKDHDFGSCSNPQRSSHNQFHPYRRPIPPPRQKVVVESDPLPSHPKEIIP